MKADHFSSCGMYGNHTIFTKHASDGCKEIAFGSGPWVRASRLVGIFVFYFPRDKVKTFETWKNRDFEFSHRGTQEGEYTGREFKNLAKKWQLRLTGKGSLPALMKEWTGGIKRSKL